MKWNHLKAMLWMRWRLMVNRVRRASKLGNVLLGVMLVLGALCSMGFFVLALVLGLEKLPDAEPFGVMVTWVILACFFLLMWLIGLLMDLQRSDSMSFKNLLHLPVSLGWVFLYNYLSSFVSISIALFLPPMLGLSLAMVIVHGPQMLIAFPLVFAYFGMITAFTYHLRGWLSRMMEDKRRGRNIVAGLTFGLVLMFQLPNLANMYFAGKRDDAREERVEAEHLEDVAMAELPEDEQRELRKQRREERRAERDEGEKRADSIMLLSSKIVPIGWLPLGVRTAYEGRILTSLACLVGLLLLASASLVRSFRATLASFLGEEKRAKTKDVENPQPDAPSSNEPKGTPLVERTFPFTGELASGIAGANLRSLLRAPEGKMLLLGPVIIFAMMAGGLLSMGIGDKLASFAPVATLSVSAMGMLGLMQVMQNQFGLDRQGFRAYVLSPVPRHLILRGKNAGLAPITLGFGLLGLIGLQLFVGLGLLHFVGACFQLLSLYMILCMIGNAVSIISPMKLKEHGMKAAHVKASTVIWQILSVLLLPVAISPLMIPYGIEMLFDWLDWQGGAGVYLVLHGAFMAGLYVLYGRSLKRQGVMLQAREQDILELLTRE